MSNPSTTPSSSDLATLIYSTLILDHLKSNSNLELNLHKNLFRKFFYPLLISFLDNELSAQPHSYKSFIHMIRLFRLRFVSLDVNTFYIKMDLSNSQLDLGLELDYDTDKEEETEFQVRLKIYKLKEAKRFEIIKYSLFILQFVNVLILWLFLYWDFISKLTSKRTDSRKTI